MAITTADEFFAVLEKSRLLEAKQLAEARRIAEHVEDPTAVAKLLARRELITHWQAAQLLAGRTVLFVGKYKLIRLLGHGGMGNVFLGEHVTMNRRVALKFISRQMGKDRASLERFLAEARAVAALDHPNIVQAYNVDNEGDRYYIVMEYIDGLDLQRLVETKGPLEYDLAADYIRQAADGLAHAHDRNMVHCDIKPSNLLVNPQGVVKILDMGLSRLIEREGGGPRPDQRVLGSVDYLSPEQALGSADLDRRTDIYALGCTLYFLLTGHPPFPEGTLPERILKHQTQAPRDIRKDRPDAPADLVDICVRMMAKRPADRIQSAAEVSRALQQWKPASGSKPVVPLPLSEEETVAGQEGDFASDPWWDTISASPTRNSSSPRKSGSMRAVKAAALTPATATPTAAAGTATATTATATGTAAANAAGGKAGLKKLGWLGTPGRKIAVLGGLALAIAAIGVAVDPLVFMLGRKPSSTSTVQVPAKSSPSPKDKEKRRRNPKRRPIRTSKSARRKTNTTRGRRPMRR